MKELLSIESTGTNAVKLITGVGEECRLVAAIMQITGATAGEVCTLSFRRGATEQARVLSATLQSAEVAICWNVGAKGPQLILAAIDPVTGVATYAGSCPAQGGSLPEVWWPYEIAITPGTGGASITGTIFLYERRRAFAWKKGYPSLRDP